MPNSRKKSSKDDSQRNSGGNNYNSKRPQKPGNRTWRKWTKEPENVSNNRHFNSNSRFRPQRRHRRNNWDHSSNGNDYNEQPFYMDIAGSDQQSQEFNSPAPANPAQHTYFNVSSLFGPSERFPPNWNSFSENREYYKDGDNSSNRSHSKSEMSRNKSSSPLLGTEEYNQLKIQEVSEQIKLKLLDNNEYNDRVSECASETPSKRETTSKESHSKSKKDKSDRRKSSSNKAHKKSEYNVEEIHSKIMNHLSNMSHGRKMNFINASSGVYDVAIQKIQKQKRLELSKALRNMCTNQSVENADAINSIIPDLDIKIESLPLEVIKELSNTLDLDLNLQNSQEDLAFSASLNTPVTIKQESSVFDDYYEEQDEHKSDFNQVKTEPIEEPSRNNDDDDDDDDYVEIIEMSSSEDEVEEIFEVKKEPVMSPIQAENSNELVAELATCNCVSLGVNLDVTITKMFEIDREIDRLTKLRQNLFTDLLESQSRCQNNRPSTSQSVKNSDGNDMKAINNSDSPAGKILVIKYIDGELLAASENGQLYIIDVSDMAILKTVDVSTTPITSLTFKLNKSSSTRLFVGCLETNIKEFNLNTKELVRMTPLSGTAQCLEISPWNFLFIGCANGYLIRFSLHKNKVEFEECISDNNAILVLKATKEGARRVLIVGTRNSPVTVRDAGTFLHMRTMDGLTSPTVYSLLLENSLVYCGTTTQDILIYSFHAGHLIRKHHATGSKGVSCMKMVENLLFASCYDGKIYVYDTKPHQMVGVVDGPGGVILSMEIVDNLIIVGTMSKIFTSVEIPEDILGQLQGQGKKRKRKDESESTEEPPKKHRNTAGPSKEYRTLVPAYLALTLLRSKEVLEFSMFSDGSASKCFALNAKLKNGTEMRKIILMKYQSSEGRKLQIRCFELDTGKYTFSEGYHNYLKFQPDREDYDFVMYTNCVFGMSPKKKSSAFAIDCYNLLNTSPDKKKSVVQFKNSEIWDKYGDFLEHFYVYHSQKDGDCMKEEMFEFLSGLGCSEIAFKRYLNCFEKVRRGSTSELRKSDLITILSNLILGPNALVLKSSPQIDILSEVFSKFDFTVLDGLDFEFLQQFSVKSSESEENLLVRRPLVVNIDENTSGCIKFLLRFCQKSSEPLMVVLTGSGCEGLTVDKFGDDFRIFRKISDLKESPNKDLYSKILDNFCMTLQGEKALEKVRLKQLFNISEGMVDVFSASDLAKLIGDN